MVAIDILNEKSHDLTHELIPILNKYDAFTGWISMTNLMVELCQREKEGQGEKISKDDFLKFISNVWDDWETLKNMDKHQKSCACCGDKIDEKI